MPMSVDFKRRLFRRIPAIAGKFGTPFQIDDEEGIRMTLRALNSAFSTRGIDFKEYYAVKANPQQAILDVIREEGGGFDCSSIPELRLARAVGATAEEIMFTSNNTSREEFSEALNHGGCILNLDDTIFIDKLMRSRFAIDLLSFRLNPGLRKTGSEVNSIIGDPVNSKYGVPIEGIVEAYRRARDELKITRFGLHTMVCSNDRDYTHMVSTVKLLLEVAMALSKELGIKVEFINMGGGIGIPYRPNETPFDIETLALECKIQLTAFEAIAGFRPRLCMESGRYVTGPHGVLVNRVINVYKKYKKFVGVEVAMPALMRVGMYPTAYHHCTVLDRNGVEKTGPTEIVTIVGSICENCDVLARDMELPVVEEGDYIVTEDTCAHGTAMGFNYNGRTRPQILFRRENGTIQRICRAETYYDLISRSELSGDGHVLRI